MANKLVSLYGTNPIFPMDSNIPLPLVSNYTFSVTFYQISNSLTLVIHSVHLHDAFIIFYLHFRSSTNYDCSVVQIPFFLWIPKHLYFWFQILSFQSLLPNSSFMWRWSFIPFISMMHSYSTFIHFVWYTLFFGPNTLSLWAPSCTLLWAKSCLCYKTKHLIPLFLVVPI